MANILVLGGGFAGVVAAESQEDHPKPRASLSIPATVVLQAKYYHLCKGREPLSKWVKISAELKNRGLEDVLTACVDGLKGFPEAIESIFPRAQVQ